MRFLLILSLLIILTNLDTSAQTDTTKVFRIILKQDSEFTGKIISENDKIILLETLEGIKIEIEKEKIKERELLVGMWDGNIFIKGDPNKTRLFFSPTGRMLKAGEGYFSDYWLFFPFVAIGITDFVTLSGGLTLIPGAERQIFYLAPRIGIVQRENFALSGGVLYATVFDESFGIAYSVASFGNIKNSITIGMGYGFQEGKLADRPVVVLGGEFQVSNSVKILTENWIVPGAEGVIISLGLRFFGEHLAADFGLFTSTKAKGDFPFIPWLGFCYNF